MSAFDLSVIVLTYNGRANLTRCLTALQRQRLEPGLRVEILLADNASSDGSSDFARAQFPGVRVVRFETNHGYTGGNNRAAALAGGDWLVFLNDDTEPDEDWLAALVRASRRHPEIRLLTSRMVFMHDSATLDSAGDEVSRWGGAWKRGHGQPISTAPITEEVFGACGGAFMIRRALFESLGGFDEDFFLSHEDVDLSYRARLAGERCLYVADATVAHAVSASLGRSSERSVYYGQRNLEWVFIKNTPAALLPIALPLHAVYLAAAGAYFVSIGHGRTFVRAKIDALRGLPRVLGARRRVQAARQLSAAAVWRLLAPGFLGVKLREKRADRELARGSRET